MSLKNKGTQYLIMHLPSMARLARTGKLTCKNLKAVQELNLNSMGERASLWVVDVLLKKPGPKGERDNK